jgi:hypothetical protein
MTRGEAGKNSERKDHRMNQATDDLDNQATNDLDNTAAETFSDEVSDDALEAAAGTWSGGVHTTCSFFSAPCC